MKSGSQEDRRTEADRRLVRDLLREIDALGLEEAKKETGLSITTIARYRNDEWTVIRPTTRRAITDYLRRKGVEPPQHPDYMLDGDRLVDAFEHPAVRAFMGDPDPGDVAAAVYAWAAKNNFPAEEMDKIHRRIQHKRRTLLGERGRENGTAAR